MRLPIERQNAVVTFGVCALLLMCLSSSGCAGLASNLLHAIYGHEQKPEYEGLKKQRIAIICANESGMLSDDVTNNMAMTLRSAMVTKLRKQPS